MTKADIVDQISERTGLTKKDVRACAAAIGLSIWDKPAAACLSSRIPYGTMVTRDGTYYFSVSAMVPGDPNGTMVSPWPTEQGGWNLGSFRADGLEVVFEDAVNKARKP